MHKPQILTTKLHRPALPPRLVPRPHLVRRLNEGLQDGCQVSLITAPAGYGKTTCACEWLQSVELPSTWLSLDAADNDSARFLIYFLAALQKVDGNIGREIQAVLQTGQAPPLEITAAELVNDLLSVNKKLLLVLDDFQIIQEPFILKLLEKLIANQPPALHLVIVSREDPLLPLARLRAGGRLTEIRLADLRFSTAETAQFFSHTLKMDLGKANAAALEERTEGWVAGLQLAGLSMRGRGDPGPFIAALTGSHRFILSYLTEEVINRQPEEVRSFLLQTSILSKLNAALCDAVTGRTDSRELLEYLYAANLFLLPLDNEGSWYRYHQLFADLLRSQLSRGDAAVLAQLHRRASAWFEQAGQPAEAIGHALESHDYAHAVQLVEAHAMPFITAGFARTVESWMQVIPSEWHAHSPRASLALASMHLLRGGYRQITPYLIKAEAALTRPGQPESPILQAELCAIRANLHNVLGDPTASISAARQAQELNAGRSPYVDSISSLALGGAYRLLDDYPRLVEAYRQAISASRAAGIPLAEMMAVSALTLSAVRRGQLRLAWDTAAESIDRLQRQGQPLPPIAGPVAGVLGLVALEWNQLDTAHERLEQCLRLSTLAGHNAGIVFARVLQSRLLQARGELKAAAEAAGEAAALASSGLPAWLQPEVPAQLVRTALAQNQPYSAETVLQKQGLSLQNPSLEHGELLTLALLRLLVYRVENHEDVDNRQSSFRLANSLVEASSGGGRIGITLPALLLRARLHLSAGKLQDAQNDVQQAVELAHPGEYLRTFLDEGPAIRLLLQRIPGGTHADYIHRLLKAWGAPGDKQQGLRTDKETDDLAPVESLSDRELEVLRLIAAGHQYNEIAGQLFITLNTVRFHVKCIYRKLNANNRTRAVQTARRLGWIE